VATSLCREHVDEKSWR